MLNIPVNKSRSAAVYIQLYTGTFVNQVIGLARNYKKEIRRVQRFGKDNPGRTVDMDLVMQELHEKLRKQIVEDLVSEKYFDVEDARLFANELVNLLAGSTPEYKWPGKRK